MPYEQEYIPEYKRAIAEALTLFLETHEVTHKIKLLRKNGFTNEVSGLCVFVLEFMLDRHDFIFTLEACDYFEDQMLKLGYSPNKYISTKGIATKERIDLAKRILDLAKE